MDKTEQKIKKTSDNHQNKHENFGISVGTAQYKPIPRFNGGCKKCQYR